MNYKKQSKKFEELYTSGLSTCKIGKLFNISAQTVSNYLHKSGIKMKTREEACTKYNIDSSYFNFINTEEKAYWLGFITADGGIVNHQLIISLKMTDSNHIDKFKKSIMSTHPIKISKTTINNKEIKQPRLTISSKSIIAALKKLGVGERKSLTVKPAIIPDEFQIPYWRGYFDGDGHINISANSRVMELTGNKYMLKGFAKFVYKTTKTTSKLQKHKSVYRIRYSKRSYVFIIAKLLYHTSNVYLDRKYKIAKSILEDEFFHLRKNSKMRALLAMDEA